MTAVQPRKVAATVADRPALSLAVEILLPTPAARGCMQLSHSLPEKEKKKNTPPQPKKKISLVSGFRAHSCAHLKLFYFLTKLRATTDEGSRSRDR
jgi:hypothetical protein